MHPANGTRGLRRAALGAAFAVLAQGCSALFIRPPSSESMGDPPQCTESRAAPVADTLVAVPAFILFGAALGPALTCSPNCGENAGPAVAILTGAALLVAGASAVHGFSATNRCREAVTSWCASHDCGEPDAPR